MNLQKIFSGYTHTFYLPIKSIIFYYIRKHIIFHIPPHEDGMPSILGGQGMGRLSLYLADDGGGEGLQGEA